MHMFYVTSAYFLPLASSTEKNTRTEAHNFYPSFDKDSVYRMPYVNADGSVQDNRSWFRFSIITDLFWGVANTVALFVNTLINPRAPVPRGKYVSSSGCVSSSAPKPPSSFRPTGKANIKTLPKNCATGS